MKAEILSVGTEILLGQITDTNASYLGQQLAPLGIDLYWVSAVGDNMERLTEIVARAFKRSDLLIITGGVGPTEDDLTREAIAAVLGEEMQVQPELERDLRDFFKRRGVEMPARNVKQATLIPSAKPLSNPIGTAPGWFVEKDGHFIVAMPGVPVEMKRMWQEQAAPLLRESTGGQVIRFHNLKTIGLGESTVGDLIAELLESDNPTLATYAKNDGVHVRIAAKADSVEAADKLIAVPEKRVREILGDAVYGVDDETLEEVTGKLLQAQSLTLAVAEGATAGLVSSTLANFAGSSEYLKGSVIAYGEEGRRLLQLPEGDDQLTGEELAVALASAVRELLGTDVGLGVCGAAGPTESEVAPIGQFHVAVNNRGRVLSETSVWKTTRNELRRRASLAAMAILRKSLLEGPAKQVGA